MKKFFKKGNIVEYDIHYRCFGDPRILILILEDAEYEGSYCLCGQNHVNFYVKSLELNTGEIDFFRFAECEDKVIA